MSLTAWQGRPPTWGGGHAPALGIVTMVLAMVTVVAVAADGGTTLTRLGALLVVEVFVLVAGVLLYVCWRLRHRPCDGWLATAALGLGFSELPFLVLSLPDPQVMLAVGAEPSEILAGALLLTAFVLAARNVPMGGLSPLTLGLLAASLIGLFRVTAHEWLHLPQGWLDGTALPQRLTMGALTVACLVVLLRRSGTHRPLVVAFALLVFITGTASTFDDRHTLTAGLLSAVTALCVAVVIGEQMLSSSLRRTITTIEERLAELADLAVRAAAVESSVDRDAAVLEQVRAGLAPLARASADLEESLGDDDGDAVSPAQQAAFQEAVSREISRANTLLARD